MKNSELEKYIADLGVEYVGTVIAYHGAGASFMKGKPVWISVLTFPLTKSMKNTLRILTGHMLR